VQLRVQSHLLYASGPEIDLHLPVNVLRPLFRALEAHEDAVNGPGAPVLTRRPLQPTLASLAYTHLTLPCRRR
jgi:hypothetical protein